MVRTASNIANGFAACQIEAESFRFKLRAIRQSLQEQIEGIDRYLEQGDWHIGMQSPPRPAGYWIDEWAAVSRKEADEETP